MCEQVELTFWDWCAKVAEKLTFMRLKQQDHKDITDEDYTLLKVLYKPFYNGEYPLYVTKMECVPENTCQNGLFDEVLTEETANVTDGTEIDSISYELKTEKK